MPKNFKGTNTKAVAARERRAAAEADRVSQKQKEEDDAYWKDDDKQVARKQQRKSEREGKRLEQLERKKEAAADLEKEEESLATAKAAKSAKVTQAQIRAQAEARQRAALASAAEATDVQRGGVVVAPAPLEENPNQRVAQLMAEDGSVEARSVTDAISALSVQEKRLERHPERRLKATYNSFEAYRLPQLKLENPSLRQSQLRQIIRKEWVKSPENPMNQEHDSYNA